MMGRSSVAPPRQPPRRWLQIVSFATLIVSANVGCAQLLDANDYAVGATSGCGVGFVTTTSGCVAIGVGECAQGFVSDASGGCSATLPTTSCGANALAYPGLSACRPLDSGVCLRADQIDDLANAYPNAVFVAPSGASGAGDGSVDKPFATLDEALASSASDHIVLLPGSHSVSGLVVARPVTIEGVCASTTEITGESTNEATIRFDGSASGSRLRSLSITGKGLGVVGVDANLTIERVRIHDTSNRGAWFLVTVEDSGDNVAVSFVDSLIDATTGVGVRADGVALSMTRSQVRGIRASTSLLDWGQGVYVRPSTRSPIQSPSQAQQSLLSLDTVLIEKTIRSGVEIEGSRGTIERSVIRDIEPSSAAATVGVAPGGWGVDLHEELARGVTIPPESPFIVRLSTIERTHDAAIRSWRASVRVEDTTITDVDDRSSAACAGHGLRVVTDHARTAEAWLVRSVVRHATQTAVHVLGGAAHLERSWITDVRTDSCGAGFSDGVAAHAQPNLGVQGATTPLIEIAQSRVDGARRSTLSSFGARISASESYLEAEPGAQLAVAISNDGSSGWQGAPNITFDASECAVRGVSSGCSITQRASSSFTPSLYRRALGGERSPAFAFSGRAKDSSTKAPLVGMNVWLRDADETPAAMSDADGQFSFPDMPSNTPVVLTFSLDGYGAAVESIQASSDDGLWSDFVLGTLSAEYAAYLAATSKAPTFADGSLSLRAPRAGLNAIISPPPSALVYLDNTGKPRTGVLANVTSERGGILGFQAVPAITDVRFRTASTNVEVSCAPVQGTTRIGLSSKRLVLPVFPGVWNVGLVSCP